MSTWSGPKPCHRQAAWPCQFLVSHADSSPLKRSCISLPPPFTRDQWDWGGIDQAPSRNCLVVQSVQRQFASPFSKGMLDFRYKYCACSEQTTFRVTSPCATIFQHTNSSGAIQTTRPNKRSKMLSFRATWTHLYRRHFFFTRHTLSQMSQAALGLILEMVAVSVSLFRQLP